MATTPQNNQAPLTPPADNVDTILAAAGAGTAKEAVDKLLQQMPIGPVSNAIGNAFYGINHRVTPGAIQINKDFHGLTFFTRPAMNFSTVNLRTQRVMTPFLTNQASSLPRIIRCLLDPRLGYGTPTTQANGGNSGITSPLVDNQQAFIPILTNSLLSINGWPDVIAQTYTAPEGVYKESYSFVDGTTQNYGAYDITATFRNMPGDPITAMFLAWVRYASMVFEGLLVPYPDFIIENEIDYQTRIYRLVLDNTKTKVQKIAACGAAFPMSSPIGASFNYEHDRPINNANDQISIPFRCIGAMYNDDILISEFNKTVVLFNNGMDDSTRSTGYTMVPLAALTIFNYKGYPRINPDTYVLEWWVDNDTYNHYIPTYNPITADLQKTNTAANNLASATAAAAANTAYSKS